MESTTQPQEITSDKDYVEISQRSLYTEQIGVDQYCVFRIYQISKVKLQ